MQTTHIFVGIDVSKSELVVAANDQGSWIKGKVENTLEGIKSWLEQLNPAGKSFILESTGSYSERLIHVLHEHGATFSVINPSQSRAMSKALSKPNKTDDQDAKTLSILGEKLETRQYKMPTAGQKKRKEAFSALCSLQKQERQLKNQIHAFEYRVDPNPVAIQALKDVLSSVQASIKALEEQMCPPQEDEKAHQLVERITSIKCVGLVTARAVVTLFGDFSDITGAKAFARFLGVAPSEYSSGTSVRARSKITKNGHSKIRGLLFNCARTAMRFNPNCKAIYERLIAKGKNGKVALTAVMHKLARIIYGVVHSQCDFNPEYALNKQKVQQKLTL